MHNATVGACARALGLSVNDLRVLPLERLLARVQNRPSPTSLSVRVLYEQATQPELVAWIERHGLTILEIVPSFLAVVLDLLPEERLRSGVRSLRLMISTGEALPLEVARRWYKSCPDIPLMNAYGPTECSDDVVHHVVTEAECWAKARPSIGRSTGRPWQAK